MTNSKISKKLLEFKQAEATILSAAILNTVAMFAFILSQDYFTLIIVAVCTTIIWFCYANVRKGKKAGLIVGAVMYGLNAILDIVVAMLITMQGTLIVNLLISIGFMITFISGAKARTEIPDSINIVETLDIFTKDQKRQKKEKTWDAKAYRDAIKAGTFEMELFYKSSDSDFEA